MRCKFVEYGGRHCFNAATTTNAHGWPVCTEHQDRRSARFSALAFAYYVQERAFARGIPMEQAKAVVLAEATAERWILYQTRRQRRRPREAVLAE